MISNMRRSLGMMNLECIDIRTVPEPTIVPAQNERVLQIWVMISQKRKCISGPDSTSPNVTI